MDAAILTRLGLGLLISTAIALVAARRGSLSQSGVWGAILTGTVIFGFGGWVAGILLVAFFASSSALSKYKAQSREKHDAALMFDKGGRRDIWQALANGGAAAALAIPAGLAPDSGTQLLCTAAMLGALTTVTADTWATELGVLSKHPPMMVTTFKPAAPGTSGAISAAGLASALAGALFIALCFVAFSALPGYRTLPAAAPLALAAVPAGVLGSLFDSYLGATAQAQYFSTRRNKPTEKDIDADGMPNQHVSGWRWLNNDWVNFLSSLAGAGVAALLYIAR
jgi:uncharacterized protein (TIGR00297 family)